MAKIPLGNYDDDDFKIKLTLFTGANPKIVASGTLPQPIPGFASKFKGVFKIDPNGLGEADDEFSSWQLFDSKGNLAISYSNFGDPKNVEDVLGDLETIFDDATAQEPEVTLEAFYGFWNSLYDGDFTAKVGAVKKTFIDVGTGGKADITGGKGADTVFVFHEKEIDFNGGKGSDTIAFRSQFLDSTVVGAEIDLEDTGFQDNPFSIETGTIKLTNVENVIGTFGDDILRGTSGKNRLDGGGDGYDTLEGREGNDTLVYSSATKTLKLADGGDGIDHLIVDLSPISGSTIHVIDQNNFFNHDGIFKDGKIFDVEVFSVGDFNPDHDDVTMQHLHFIGFGLDETVTAGNGNDHLEGRGGADILTGLGGQDTLEGGLDADRFVYKTLADSTSADPDEITDFSHDEGDRIDLRAIDANTKMKGNQAFKFVGLDDGFSGKKGELYYGFIGEDLYVYGDVNGDTIADIEIVLDDIASLGLVKADFFL